MYATCLFCNHSLGANEAIEAFPVGRRLAFDAGRGRLWVICRRCERWNLSPIEERWEAIEECERLYRATRRRVATEQIGLARIAEGLELVRIGQPLRPEFAAWRYGDQFGRRRRRTILIGTSAIAIGGVVVIGGAVAGVISSAVLAQSGNIVNLVMNGRTRVRVRTDDGRLLRLKNPDLWETRLRPGEEPGALQLSIGKGKRHETFTGPEAERIASIVIPKLNSTGGSQANVREAVRQIEDSGGPERFLDRTLKDADRQSMMLATTRRSTRRRGGAGAIHNLPKPVRLAVEMALHEERERRALEGELQLLEAAWREAEEIAAISDDLLLPPGTREFLERGRNAPATPGSGGSPSQNETS